LKSLVIATTSLTSLLRVGGPAAIHPASASSSGASSPDAMGLPELVVDPLRHRAVRLRRPVQVAKRGLGRRLTKARHEVLQRRA
jgi:hypothetical protein